MTKQTVPEQVNEYVEKHPEIYRNLLVTDMNDIRELDNLIDIITTAFAYGYMKAQKVGKGDVVSMRKKKWYIKEVIRIMRRIDNPVVLMKIYTVAKTHLAILNGEV